jgi:hypothetical protein
MKKTGTSIEEYLPIPKKGQRVFNILVNEHGITVGKKFFSNSKYYFSCAGMVGHKCCEVFIIPLGHEQWINCTVHNMTYCYFLPTGRKYYVSNEVNALLEELKNNKLNREKGDKTSMRFIMAEHKYAYLSIQRHMEYLNKALFKLKK